MTKFPNSQGVINAEITRLVGNPDTLKSYMATKTKEQQDLGRSHYRTVKGLMKK